MPDFYYTELYFDPAHHKLSEVVEGAVAGILFSGARFKKIVMPKDADTRVTSHGAYNTAGLDGLPDLVEHHDNQMLASGQPIYSFPPRWGRIIFEFDFLVDQSQMDAVYDEEEDSGANIKEIGLSFQVHRHVGIGHKIKATISCWEEFVFTKATVQTATANMASLLGIVQNIADVVPPYFGAMNNELRLNTDASLEAIINNHVFAINEFLYVGPAILDGLDTKRAASSSVGMRSMGNTGALMVQVAHKWGNHCAL